MKIHKLFIYANLITVGCLAISSCSGRPDVEGTWTGTPVRISNIAEAADAEASFSIVFINAEGRNEQGNIFATALIDANQAVSTDAAVIDEPYEVSVAATATISGKWSYVKSDDNDITIDFDDQSLQVNVDPHGVTFSNNVLTGVQQPTVDSLTAVTVKNWHANISNAITAEFAKFSKISDIKIKNGIVSCEIDGRDMTFRKQ